MKGKLYNFTKKSFQRILNSLGLNLIRYNAYTSSTVLLQTIIQHFGVSTILDVGANEGQYAGEILEGKYKGNIYSFEPIHSVFNKLKANAQAFPKWQVFNHGIGSEEGQTTINISENFVSSSILPIGKSSLEVEPKTRSTHRETIDVTTIDSFFAKNSHFERPILLKLDVQGYEMEALKGAIKSLSSIKLVQVELSLVSTYEGAPLYGEVIDFLEEYGFELYTIIPGFMDGKTGRLLQADGVFLNKSTALT
jgi:FkbM family methyltransferase